MFNERQKDFRRQGERPLTSVPHNEYPNDEDDELEFRNKKKKDKDSILIDLDEPKPRNRQSTTGIKEKSKKIRKPRDPNKPPKKKKIPKDRNTVPPKPPSMIRTLNVNDPTSFSLNVENIVERGFGDIESSMN